MSEDKLSGITTSDDIDERSAYTKIIHSKELKTKVTKKKQKQREINVRR